jgi:hypothetical protein
MGDDLEAMKRDGRTREGTELRLMCLLNMADGRSEAVAPLRPVRSLHRDGERVMQMDKLDAHSLDIGTAAAPLMTEVGRRGSLQAVEPRQLNTDGLAVADKFRPSWHGSFYTVTWHRTIMILDSKTCYTMK